MSFDDRGGLAGSLDGGDGWVKSFLLWVEPSESVQMCLEIVCTSALHTTCFDWIYGIKRRIVCIYARGPRG